MLWCFSKKNYDFLWHQIWQIVRFSPTLNFVCADFTTGKIPWSRSNIFAVLERNWHPLKHAYSFKQDVHCYLPLFNLSSMKIPSKTLFRPVHSLVCLPCKWCKQPFNNCFAVFSPGWKCASPLLVLLQKELWSANLAKQSFAVIFFPWQANGLMNDR